MIQRLIRWIKQAGTPSEQATERNGFMSYSAETHAIGHGLYDGMKTYKARPTTIPDNPDVQKEPHYYKGAYVLGTLIQLLITVIVGHHMVL